MRFGRTIANILRQYTEIFDSQGRNPYTG